MKKYLKITGICLLVIFSFYYTNVVSNMFIYKSDLMGIINSYKQAYEVSFVNATINDEYIIPGINGISIDSMSSYYKMKETNDFKEELIVLKETTPQDSYYDHMDLIISKGNPLKKSVSIILSNNKEILNYSIKKGIIINRLVDKDTVKNYSKYLQINNDFLHYEEVDKILDKNDINSNICIINNHNTNFCQSYGKYLVKPGVKLTNSSKLISININPGDIIYIDDNYSLSRFKLLLKKIEYQNLKLSYLDKLISENR